MSAGAGIGDDQVAWAADDDPSHRRRKAAVSSAGVLVHQAWAGLAQNRARTVAALTGLTAGTAVLTATWDAPALGVGGRWAGAVLVLVVATATAIAADPRQLRAAAVIDLLGASRWQRRAVVVLEAMLLGLLALPAGLALGTVISRVSGTAPAPVAAVAGCAVLLPMAGALVAGRARTMVTVTDARGARPLVAVRMRRWALVLRIVAGPLLIQAGWKLAADATSFFDLDLFLWPALVLVTAGLVLLVPVLLDGLAAVLSRAPGVAGSLAGWLLRARRRLVTPAVLLGVAGALAVAVHAMLGAGLTRREEVRRAELSSYQFTAGLDARQMVLGRSDSVELFLPAIVQPLPSTLVDQARTRWPDAVVAPVELLTAEVQPAPIASPGSRRVGVATPDLLAALGLEQLADDVAAGRAVALDASVTRQGRVTIVDDQRSGRRAGPIVLPAVPARPGVVATHLPAVLLPPEVADGGRMGLGAVVVRLPRPATDSDLTLLGALGMEADDTPSLPLTVWRGDEVDDQVVEDGRLDASRAIGLREPAGVRLAVMLAAAVAIVGLLVTLRLVAVTRRSDEDVMELVGARFRTIGRIAAYQAAILTAVATSLGLAVGIGLTRLGIEQYNAGGRLGTGPDETDLPPIPVIVPPVLLVVLVAAPVVAGVMAALVARRRPRVDPTAIADGLLW